MAAAILVTFWLAGCSLGDAEEAEQGQLRDAQRTSVVDELQATKSARLLAPSTPASDATDEP